VAKVDVRPTEIEGDPLEFRVTVHEDDTKSTHDVTVSRDDLARLSRPDEDPADFITRCFAFLLKREPKESIMSSFDISVIGRYFPEFGTEIAR
jgi:hypothetical protein